MTWLLLVACAYLLGAVSFSLMISRRVGGIDVREHGSGNAGASNVLRTVGKGPAALVLLLDIAKGVLPVQIARALDVPGPVIGAAALAAVVGHVLPVFHDWRGGKGVATAAGALSSLALAPAALAALVFFAVLAVTRYIALASVAAVSCFPPLLYLSSRVGWVPALPGWLMASAVAVALLIVGKHHDNLRRILDGTEHRLGESTSKRNAL